MSAPEAQPLLLHSLASFGPLVFRCLEAAGARRIVEIGSETGELTLALADWASERGGKVICVDPDPAPSVVARAQRDPVLEVVAGASPAALDGLQPGDAHLVDGDHNHWTVLRELRHAYGGGDPQSGAGPLCLVHDVGWPCARRDMYYAPDRLPAEGRHPHSYEGGVVPHRSELVPRGFRGGGDFAWAEHEGGERNGVRTAVEDALAELGGLRLAVVPSVFGLGVVWPERAPWGPAIAEIVDPLAENPLLETLEHNRLALYLRVLDLQDASSADRLRADRVVAGLQEDLGRLDAENASLRLGAGVST